VPTFSQLQHWDGAGVITPEDLIIASNRKRDEESEAQDEPNDDRKFIAEVNEFVEELADREIERLRKAGPRDMAIGALLCGGGIFISWMSYLTVPRSGGQYFVAYGAIIWGAIQFWRGVQRRNL